MAAELTVSGLLDWIRWWWLKLQPIWPGCT
jgi:hypothetical protein